MNMHQNAPNQVIELYEQSLRSLERKQVEVGLLISRATELSTQIEQHLDDTRMLLSEVRNEFLQEVQHG